MVQFLYNLCKMNPKHREAEVIDEGNMELRKKRVSNKTHETRPRFESTLGGGGVRDVKLHLSTALPDAPY